MQNYTADLSINVNLKKIAKYHSALSLMLKGDDVSKINIESFSTDIKVFIIRDSENLKLHPAFDYAMHAARLNLSERISDELIYLFYTKCVYEWEFYASSKLIKDMSNDVSIPNVGGLIEEINLNFVARETLLQLRQLCQYRESQSKNLQVNFSYRNELKKGKGARDTYKVDDVKIKELNLINELLTFTIENVVCRCTTVWNTGCIDNRL